ncbi:MAG: LamG-like jellyroll fold domain-containing protein [Verrucomicrobiales bacterium]
MKTNSTLLFTMMLALGGPALAQTVYLDTFDDDGLETNANAGGGGVSLNFNGGGGTNWGWSDDGALSGGLAASGNRITIFSTDTAFYIDEGFTLEIDFDMPANGTTPFPANHLSFGLSAVSGVEEGAEDSNLFHINDFAATYDAIGFSLGNRNGNVDMGLIEWNGAGTSATLSPFDFTAGTGQTISLTVNSDGTYSYTYGEITGTGTTSIDLTQPYYFKVRTQASDGNALQRVLLDTSSQQPLAPPTITATEELIERGESIDLVVTFDPGADVAELTTPSGTVDLITLDLFDDNPDDGVVELSEFPLDSFTYVVESSRTGETPDSASYEILVAVPSDEPADNDFSTAIKSDSPLFYYRYEEPADSGYLLDSSGNGHHAGPFAGPLLQGESPGGMQLAGRSEDNAAIAVPVGSEMSESFTFVALVNLEGFNANYVRHILSMADGNGTGRSLLYYSNGSFKSYISGATTDFTATAGFPENVSCLIHYVYDADASELKFYINGELQGEPIAVGAVGANLGEWVLLSQKNLEINSYLGWIDETAVFESALTDAQIADHSTAFLDSADPLLGFISDSSEVDAGDPVTLTWKTSNQAWLVTLNGESVDGAFDGGLYSTTVNPTTTTTYTLEVNGESREITITVLTPLEAPVITSVTTDDATPPSITIEIQGAASTSYNVQSSLDLSDGFPTAAGTITTDETGYGTATFDGLGTAGFYRVEVP